jgi:lipopolysaccharide export system protein LptA
MLASLAVFLVGFRVYGHFLGGIDGLTPLPEDYWPYQGEVPWQPPPRQNDLENKLRMAFGEGPELKRIFKLEIPSRHLVLAADDFIIPKEGKGKGKVFLPLLSIGVFGVKGTYPEINTVTCNKAYLTFDKEITTPDQIGKSKLIAAELIGDVKITNNRRTPERYDDLVLLTQGPVYYQESMHRIWTNAVVKLMDMQSRPNPTEITAVGMDLDLTQETTKRAEAHKAKPDSISGVDQISLRSNVRMDLYVDPQSGFLAPEKPTPKSGAEVKSAPPPALNKDHVVITTDGPFHYDVGKDKARFDISHRQSPLSSRVHVTREHQNSTATDELYCDRLDLQFQRKNASSQQLRSVGAEDRSVELEIESADASQLYEPVKLSSDLQGLTASGHDLHYDARTRQSTLTGNPQIHAMKDGNEILAHELVLTGIDKKETQQAKARGPGKIDMLDRAKGNRTLHARWKDLLTYTKEGPYDCLILTGDAVFEDEEHGQNLQAQKIKVWLEPVDANNPGAKDQQQRLRPHHLEAYGQVRIESSDLQVVDPTDTLVIWFEDGPVIGPVPFPPGGIKDGAVIPDDPVFGTGKKPVQSKPGPAGMPASSSENTKKPLRLSAHVVKAHVIRSDNKYDLKTLECDGTVRVFQDPTAPDDKGVDIRGDALQLNHYADGNVLVVTGNSQYLAQVQLNKITIHGHEVRIDQIINSAKVDGAGDMLMLTTTDFEGNKLAKPTELTIHWDKAMRFDGKHAEFSGGIQAEQNNSRLLCQEMQVDLDRPVSFKEGERNGQPAKVDRLVCDKRRTDKPVFIEDQKWQGRKLIGYQRLVAPEVSVDNKNGKIDASGPGIVSLLQMGSAEDDPLTPNNPRKSGAPPARPVKQKKEELKLTRITYDGRMNGDNVRRIAIFYDHVLLIYGPADDPDIKVDPANPHPGFMVLNCDKLSVYSHPLPNGQKSQEMEANYRVRVHAQEFWGNARTITYDEAKDVVVLKGTEDNPAVLYRVKTKGARAESIIGKTISYYRTTRAYRVDGGVMVGINP